jgi:exodeoxyribonuclease VII small subunit
LNVQPLSAADIDAGGVLRLTAARSDARENPRLGGRCSGLESRGADVTEAKPDIAEMRFEDALAELEGIVDRLEKGAVALDESIRLYERGEALKKRCDELLKNAEIRIEKITLSADGAIRGVVALDDE